MRRLYNSTIPDTIKYWKEIPIWDYFCLIAVMIYRLGALVFLFLGNKPELAFILFIYAHILERDELKPKESNHDTDGR